HGVRAPVTHRARQRRLRTDGARPGRIRKPERPRRRDRSLHPTQTRASSLNATGDLNVTTIARANSAGANMLKVLIAQIEQLQKPWHQMPEREQEVVIFRLREAVES